MGPGQDQTCDPLDLQPDWHLLPDTLPTAKTQLYQAHGGLNFLGLIDVLAAFG